MHNAKRSSDPWKLDSSYETHWYNYCFLMWRAFQRQLQMSLSRRGSRAQELCWPTLWVPVYKGDILKEVSGNFRKKKPKKLFSSNVSLFWHSPLQAAAYVGDGGWLVSASGHHEHIPTLIQQTGELPPRRAPCSLPLSFFQKCVSFSSSHHLMSYFVPTPRNGQREPHSSHLIN